MPSEFSEIKVPLRNFFSSSYDAWRRGNVLAFNNKSREYALSTSLDEFIKQLSVESSDTFSSISNKIGFWDEEFFISGGGTSFLLTNKRLFMSKVDDLNKEIDAYNIFDIKSIQSKGFWTSSATVKLNSGEEVKYSKLSWVIKQEYLALLLSKKTRKQQENVENKKNNINNELTSLIFTKTYYHYHTVYRNNSITTINEHFTFTKNSMYLRSVEMEDDESNQIDTNFYCPQCGHEIPIKVDQVKCIAFLFKGQDFIKEKLIKTHFKQLIIWAIISWIVFNVLIFVVGSQAFHFDFDMINKILLIPYGIVSFVLFLLIFHKLARKNVIKSLTKNSSVIVRKSAFKKYLNEISEYDEFNIITNVELGKGMHAFNEFFRESGIGETAIEFPSHLDRKYTVYI